MVALPAEIPKDTPVPCPRWVDYKGTKYSLKNILVTGFSSETGCPVFEEIKIIVPSDNGDMHFICSPLGTLGYYSEVRGYQVDTVPEFSNKSFGIKQENRVDYHPLSKISTGQRLGWVFIVETFP